MKLDEATRAELRRLRDELLNPAIEDSRVVEIIRVFAAYDMGVFQRAIADSREYRRNRKRLLGRVPLETTTAA